MKKGLIAALTAIPLFTAVLVSNTGSYATDFPGNWTIHSGTVGKASGTSQSLDGKKVFWSCDGGGICATADGSGLHVNDGFHAIQPPSDDPIGYATLDE